MFLKHSKKIFALILALMMLCTSFSQITFAKKDVNTTEAMIKAIHTRKRPINQKRVLSKSINAKRAKSDAKSMNESVRLVVELDEAPLVMQEKGAKVLANTRKTKDALNKIKKSEDNVKALMRKAKIDFKELYSLNTFVSGFSIYTKRKNIAAIEKIKGVKRVHISEKYTLPKTNKGDKPQMYASLSMISAPNVWASKKYKGEGQVVAVLDTGFDMNNLESFRLDDYAKKEIALTKNKVNELKEKYGLKGKYICEKIPYVYNYHDETADLDALQDRYGSRHGLHVAGTIGANEADDYKNANNLAKTPIKGVAPNAQLIIMKVFSTSLTDLSTYSDAQCKAIEDAYKLGADVMNLSLGSPAGFITDDDIVQVAMQNAIKAGCLVAVANGNEGTSYFDADGAMKALEGNPDYGMAGSPATGWATTSVAAITNTKYLVCSLGSNNDKIKNIKYTWGSEITPENYTFNKFVYANKGKASDINKIEPEKIKDALVLVDRGECTFNEKASNARDAGAKGVIVINTDDEPMTMVGFNDVNFPAVIVGNTDGKKILKYIDDSGLSISFNKEMSVQDNPKAGQMADFTSWGPTPDLTMKPEITAPGADIYSIDQDYKYQVMSGTSMATPHVAGAAAIVMQFIKDRDSVFYEEAKDASKREALTKTLLMNTAIPQKDEETYYPVRRQGAGLIDLANLMKAKATVKATGKNDRMLDAKAELKSFADKEFTIDYTLKNYSDEDIAYTLEPAMLTEKFVNDKDFGSVSTETDRDMNFSIDKKSVIAKASSTIKFSVKFNFANDDINLNNYVEGFLRFVPEDTEKDATLTVPYLGFYGDWSKPRLFDVFSHEWSDDLKPNILNKDTNDAMGDVFDFTEESDEAVGVDNKVNSFEYKGKMTYITNHDSSEQIKIRFGLLRNTEYIKARIEDASNKILMDNLIDLSYFAKSRLAENGGENWISLFKEDFAENDFAKVILKGKLNTEKENIQEVSVPIYFDDNKPIIKLAEIISKGDAKYVKLSVSDDIGIDTIGVQQVKETGKDDDGEPIYNNHKYNEVSGLYYGNTDFYTEDEARVTEQDEKVTKSLEKLKDSKKLNTVYVKVDDICDIEKLCVYVKDIAGNWAEEKVLDTNYKSNETVKLKLIGESAAFWTETTSSDKSKWNDNIYNIQKGSYGEVQIQLPDNDKEYAIGSAIINGEEYADKFEYDQDARLYYMPYRFEDDTTFTSRIYEVKPADAKGLPQGNGYPSIYLTQPENAWTVSENGPLNDQGDAPEIEDGKLNVIGAVAFTDKSDLAKLTLRIIDDVNKKVLAEKDITNEVKLEQTGEISNADGVIYDGLALVFKTSIDMVKGYSNLKLQVEAENKSGKKTITAATIAVDESPATFNYTIDKRGIASDKATIKYTLADDNKSTEIIIDRVTNDDKNEFIETVYRKLYDKFDIDRLDAVRYINKDKFTVKLKPGYNKFKVSISEVGTARVNEKYIIIYRLDPSIKLKKLK